MSGERTLLVQLQRPSGAWVDVGLVREAAPRVWFESLPGYWELPERPVLGWVFEDRGDTWRPSASTALPRWFSHLLPEGRFRAAVAQGAGVHESREFALLEQLGQNDLPGAVRAVAESGVTASDDPILKFSLAGAQMKFSLVASERGLTVPARGEAGDTIVKLPDGRPGFDGVPEAELGALTLAGAAGFAAPEVWLVDPATVDGVEKWAERTPGPALAIARFDRLGTDRRVHMEVAQILDIPTHRTDAKYRNGNVETIAAVVGALAGPGAVDDVVARVVLNVLVGNGDAHLKNWAVIYPDGVGAALSPVYDVVPTVLWVGDDDLGLNLGGSKDFARVTAASFDRLAARTGLDTARTRRVAAEAVDRIREHWPLLADHLTTASYERLTRRLGTLALTAS